MYHGGVLVKVQALQIEGSEFKSIVEFSFSMPLTIGSLYLSLKYDKYKSTDNVCAMVVQWLRYRLCKQMVVGSSTAWSFLQLFHAPLPLSNV